MDAQRADKQATADPSRVWLPELIVRYAAGLPPNQVACVLRLVSKRTASALNGPADTTVRLSQPSPPHEFALRWGPLGAARNLTHSKRRQLVILTTRSGSLANLQLLLSHSWQGALSSAVFAAAAAGGYLHICQHLKDLKCPWRDDATCSAAAANQQTVYQWLVDNGCPGGFCWNAVRDAAKAGHLAMVDWLLAHMRPTRFSLGEVLGACAASFDLPTLQRLLPAIFNEPLKNMAGMGRMLALAAAAGSHTPDWRDKVVYLEDCSGVVRARPAGGGGGGGEEGDALLSQCHLSTMQVMRCKEDWRERLDWLLGRGYPLSSRAASAAGEEGNVEALRYMLSEGAGRVERHHWWLAVRAGAVAGNLEVLKVLEPKLLEFPRGQVEAAAAAGQLSSVAWMVNCIGRKGALSECVFKAAVESANLELLAWLREHDCPWSAGVWVCAAAAGSEAQLEWLAEHGCPMGKDGYAYYLPSRSGDVATMRCLHRLGCSTGGVRGRLFSSVIEFYRSPADGSSLRGLRCLLELGCSVDWDRAMGWAKQRQTDRDEVVAWLKEEQAARQQWQRGSRLRSGGKGKK